MRAFRLICGSLQRYPIPRNWVGRKIPSLLKNITPAVAVPGPHLSPLASPSQSPRSATGYYRLLCGGSMSAKVLYS